MASPEAGSRSGLSLYANLLNADRSGAAPGTISSAPVVYKQPQQEQQSQESQGAEKSQISSAALRFQPTRRPQVSAHKAKPKPTGQRAQQSSAPAAAPDDLPRENGGIEPRAQTKTLADWTADTNGDDLNGFYAAEKRQRGGRKKRKKDKAEVHIIQNWDDIYDPSRPNVYEDYKQSDEKYLEIREWKDRLYAHRMAHDVSSDTDSDAEIHQNTMSHRFAPPPALVSNSGIKVEEDHPHRSPPAETVDVPSDATGEDAFLRRMRMSQPAGSAIPQQPLNTPPDNVAFPANVPDRPTDISRAPVRYNLPSAPEEIPSTEAELEDALQEEDAGSNIDPSASQEDAPRSLRPGQKGFAARLMSKYGWTKGSGLGASGSGITAPLRVQKEKQKKRPDSEGGGFVGPGGMGKIVGGQRKHDGDAASVGKFGNMSEVIKLRGMLDGMDLDQEMSTGDGGLMQEIGEECGAKYGRVERVFIDRGGDATKASVFVRFTSQLSALRAVNALEGRIFNGNTITARFFEPEKFESGIYE